MCARRASPPCCPPALPSTAPPPSPRVTIFCGCTSWELEIRHDSKADDIPRRNCQFKGATSAGRQPRARTMPTAPLWPHSCGDGEVPVGSTDWERCLWRRRAICATERHIRRDSGVTDPLKSRGCRRMQYSVSVLSCSRPFAHRNCLLSGAAGEAERTSDVGCIKTHGNAYLWMTSCLVHPGSVDSDPKPPLPCLVFSCALSQEGQEM